MTRWYLELTIDLTGSAIGGLVPKMLLTHTDAKYPKRIVEVFRS